MKSRLENYFTYFIPFAKEGIYSIPTTSKLEEAFENNNVVATG